MASKKLKNAIPKLLPIPHLASPLSHWLKGRPVIMASLSERRRQLLKQIGIEPLVVPSNLIEETINPDISLEKQVIQLANLKASSVAKHINNGIVIGADTVVVTEREVLGKPKSIADARRMITSLSGDAHFVVTGVSVIAVPEGRSLSGISRTKVKFASISKFELQSYLDHAYVLDKAGAYGIQDLAGLFVEGIEGSYSNVVGLPLELLRALLIQLLGDSARSGKVPMPTSSGDLSQKL